MADSFGDERGRNNEWLKWAGPGRYTQVTEDRYPPQNSVFGELSIAGIFPQAAWEFNYGINSRFVITSGTMAGGYVSGSFSRAELLTSTNVSGTAQIFSVRPIRHIPGFGELIRFTSVFNSGTVNSEQLIGAGDKTLSDFLAFGYNGNQFGIVRCRGGVRNWTYQDEWNGDPLSYTLIPQFGNVYQIRFQWLGYGNIYFMVFDRERRQFVTVHTIEYPNTSQDVHILNPVLNLFARIANLGNNTSLRMYTPSALGATEGYPEIPFSNPLNIPNSYDASRTLSDANNNHLITIRNKSTFVGQSNRTAIRIRSIYFSRDGDASTAASSVIRVYKNASTAGALSFTDVDSNNSPVDVSVTSTTITSTNPETSYTVARGSMVLPVEFNSNELILNPGESISIGVQNSGVQSTLVILTANWEELF